MHNISVLDEVILAFGGQFTCCTALRFTTESDEIFVFDDLRADETTFKIRMDNTGTLRGFISRLERPSAHFV